MARTFNGSNFLADTVRPVAALPISFHALMRSASGGNGGTAVGVSANSPGGVYSLLRVANGAAYADAFDGGTNAIGTVNGTTADGNWHSVGAVFVAGARWAYLDGVVGTADATGTSGSEVSATNCTEIGVLVRPSIAYGFIGDLAECAIWAGTLGSIDYAALAAGVSPLRVRPDILVGYWPLYGEGSTEFNFMRAVPMAFGGSPAAARHPRVFLPWQPIPFAGSTQKLFAAVASFAFSTAATLFAPPYVAASTSFNFSAAADLKTSPSLRSNTTISLSTAATLTVPQSLQVSAGVRVSVTANLSAGAAKLQALAEFRFGVTADLSKFSVLDTTAIVIRLAGVDVTARVKVGSLTIHDAINDEVNTARLKFLQSPPHAPNPLEIYLNRINPTLLFNGTLAHVEVSYAAGKPALPNLEWPSDAVDDGTRARKRLPFGVWTDVSATTVAQQLVAQFAPGFTSTHVQAGLPNISVTFNGTEGMAGALTQIAKLIGGYYYWEAGDLHLFTDEATELPDPIDAAHPFLNDPPITKSTDVTQVRTRVFGKGHGESVPTEVAAGETVIPIADAVMFNPSGGRAISDSQRLAYTGIHLGGGGGLVGPGASPTAAPSVTPKAGGTLPAGTYKYGYTFVTTSGESLPSPLGSGVSTPSGIASPGTAPTVAAILGLGIEDGDYTYSTTFVSGSGETTRGVNAPSVSMKALDGPSSAPSVAVSNTGGAQLTPNGLYSWRFVFVDSAGNETLPGPPCAQVNVGTYYANSSYAQVNQMTLPTSSDPNIAKVRVYRTYAGYTDNWFRVKDFNGITDFAPGSNFSDVYCPDVALGPAMPTVATAGVHRVQLTNLPIGPPGTTGRNVYRWKSGGDGLFHRVLVIADNSTTSIIDSTSNSALGPVAPSTNTTSFQQFAIASIAIGPSGTTTRKVYRTAVDGSQLKLLATLADNTTTVLAANDSAADGTLGANAPTIDMSGLNMSGGAVLAGSTTLLTAGAGGFDPAGGWAILGNGQQRIRYHGVSGNTLTGIPASGVGAITATVLYGSNVTEAPALTGVTGLTLPLIKGAQVNIWVQRDDVAAQSELAALAGDGSDGIVEYLITDERRGEASLIALCDADLIVFGRPIVTVRYATRDPKTKSGKPITIDLATPSIHETLTIQAVDIDQINVTPGTMPRYQATASTVRFSLEDVLRRLTGQLGGL